MNVGDKVTFGFAKKTKDGVIWKLFPKKVHIKADFPQQKGKIVVRSRDQIK